jgi:isocitrate/isopropylmalate dehydrogenase
MARSCPTLALRLSVVPALFPVATLAAYVLFSIPLFQQFIDSVCLQDYALFEPGCRHVAKDIMGTNKANPAAMILSATMMLRHLGLDAHANNIASATFDVINAAKVRTADMGGSATTSDFTAAVIKNLD